MIIITFTICFCRKDQQGPPQVEAIFILLHTVEKMAPLSILKLGKKMVSASIELYFVYRCIYDSALILIFFNGTIGLTKLYF
jgi:hypothetical protein